MKNKKIIGVTLSAIIIVVIAYFYGPKLVDFMHINKSVEFKGVLTDFDAMCAVDGRCMATIDGNKTVTTNLGLTVEKYVVGESEVWSDDVGKPVQVKAKYLGDNHYTLVGDESLYIKLTNP